MPDKYDAHSKNIMLIIIDQLRADYVQYLPRCAALLPYHAICDTNSIPSSTEAMHACISTGRYPKETGILSKAEIRGKNGIKAKTDELKGKGIEIIAAVANNCGFYPHIIGYKPETVEIMGAAEDCMVRLFRKDVNLANDGKDVNLRKIIAEHWEKRRRDNEDFREIDHALLDIFKIILEEIKTDKNLYVLTLPGNDLLGHVFGPGDVNIRNHLTSLDERLANIIRPLIDLDRILLIGDHGCRYTTEYVIEIPVTDRCAKVYHLQEDALRMEGYHEFDGNSVRNIEYDGGTLRISLSDGKELCENDRIFLAGYGQIYDNRKHPDILDKRLAEIHANSLHQAAGDFRIVAHGNVTFCKSGWIRGTEKWRKIMDGSDLTDGDLPRGEHGTYHQEDTETCFLSNIDFGRKKICTPDIRILIESLLK